MKWNHIGTVLVLAVFMLSGCSFQKSEQNAQLQNAGQIADQPGIYDSADTAVIVGIDKEAQTITLKNFDIKKEYTLSYDGTTCFYDKYKQAMSLDQMSDGDIVDLTFYKPRKKCNTMQLSGNAWTVEHTQNYEIDDKNRQIQFGNEAYSYSDDTAVMSNGQEITAADISPIDILSFQGIGKTVYSISVDQGHGYLRLQNDEYFYDGWVEVGDRVVQKVTENMLLTVPEGSQQVIVSNHGTSGTKNIQVERDKEVDLDVGDLKGADPQYGSVIFTITPSDAVLYIDGSAVSYSAPVKLEYGIHQMIVRADGYDSITQYLKVGQESAGIEVDMKASSAAASVSGNNASASAGQAAAASPSGAAPSAAASSGASAPPAVYSASAAAPSAADSVTSTGGYYISVTAPSGAEVYLDGNYMGVAPCNFKKTAGSHMITLRKTGYVSRSYTVQVDSEAKNATYSFPDLVAVAGN